MKNETENTRSSWLGSPHHVKVWLKFSPLQMEPSIWDMEPGAIRCPIWQVYIDDPDVANASKENISVSSLVSSDGQHGQSCWPMATACTNLGQHDHEYIYIYRHRWIAYLIYHVLGVLSMSIKNKTFCSSTRSTRSILTRSMQQGSAWEPTPSGSSLRSFSCSWRARTQGAKESQGQGGTKCRI